MRNILSSSCLCDKFVVILPASPPFTLQNLVTVLHTGHMQELSQEQASHMINLGKYLGIKLSKVDNENLDLVDEHEAETSRHDNDTQKIKTTTQSKIGCHALSFPMSRAHRDQSSKKIDEVMTGFLGRV